VGKFGGRRSLPGVHERERERERERESEIVWFTVIGLAIRVSCVWPIKEN
jgi:predicted nucleic acid-binding Zn ribbon protein